MRFTNNGHTITLHTDLEMESVRPELVAQEYDQVTISGDKFWYRKDTDFYKFVFRSGYFDYALPQSFFDEYMQKHNKEPRGVWCYEKEYHCDTVFGTFVSYRDAMLCAIVCILQSWDAMPPSAGGNGERNGTLR